jgi:hypothetical protein
MCFGGADVLSCMQIDQVKEYIRSELQQRATIEYLQRNANITVNPISEQSQDGPVIDVVAG